jgi:hypothetical protein
MPKAPPLEPPTWFLQDTPPEVIQGLEDARRLNYRVRIFYGDRNTGQLWEDEWDVVGYVGRSQGPAQRVPLLLCSRRSTGGLAIMVDHIMRLIVNRQEVYRHPLYVLPEYQVGSPWQRAKQAGYTCGVYRNGENVANFKNEEAARRWIAFMRGERLGK